MRYDGCRCANAWPIAPAEAERVIAQLARAGRDRTVFVATFADLVSARREDGARERDYKTARVVVDAKVSRVALFADPQLTRELGSLDLAPLRPRSSEPVLSEGARALGQIRIADLATVATGALRLAADPALTAEVGRTSSRYKSANEFARDDVLAGFSAVVARAPAPGSLWLGGKVRLGVYDRAAGSFPVLSYELGPVSSSTTGAEAVPEWSALKIEVANPAALARMAMSEAAARAAVESNAAREFELRARVVPVSAARDRTSTSPAVRLFADVRELVVSSPGGAPSAAVFARLQIPAAVPAEASAGRTAARGPERPVLGFDALNLLLIRHAPDRRRAFIAGWAPGAAQAAVARCFGDRRADVKTLPWTENGLDYPWNSTAAGVGLSMPERAPFQQYTPPWPPAPPFLDGDARNGPAARCPTVLIVEYHGLGQHDQLAATLVDNNRYHADLIESRRQVGAGASPSGEARPKLEVKL